MLRLFYVRLQLLPSRNMANITLILQPENNLSRIDDTLFFFMHQNSQPQATLTWERRLKNKMHI